MSGAERGADTAENDGAEAKRGAGGRGAGAKRGAGGRGAGSGDYYRNRLERGAAFSPLRAIFGNVSVPFGTLAICDPSVKILRRSSQGGTPPSGG